MTPPTGALIRRAEVSDADALTELHLDCWDDAYTGLMPQQILDDRRRRVDERVDRWRTILDGAHATVVAVADERLVGFASSGPGRDNDVDVDIDIELMALYVREAWWGTGLGYALLEETIGDHAAYLWVLDGNERAVHFYERQGFRRDGTREEQDEGWHVRMVRAGT